MLLRDTTLRPACAEMASCARDVLQPGLLLRLSGTQLSGTRVQGDGAALGSGLELSVLGRLGSLGRASAPPGVSGASSWCSRRFVRPSSP